MDADSQTYQPATVSGSPPSISAAQAAASLADTAGTANPVNFTYEQDASITDSEPSASQYLSSTLTGMNLTLESPNGVNPATDPTTALNVANTNLTLNATPGGPVYLQANLTLNSLVATGGAVSPTNNAVITTTVGGQSYTGEVVITTNSTFDASAAGANGTITINSGVINNNGPSPTLTVLTVNSGIGAGSSISGGITDQDAGDQTGLTIAGGTVTLSGSSANTYTGATTIDSGATLALSSGSSLTNSIIDDSGTFDISGATSGATIDAITGDGSVKLGAETLTVGGPDSGTFTGTLGAVNDTGGLTVAGTGNLTLSGTTINYSGATTVSGGSLALSSSMTFLGDLDVSGGTFNGGAGTLSAVNINLSNGTLTATSGTLDVSGNFTITGGTFSNAGGAVDFTGSTQSLTSGASAFNNLSHYGTGTLTLDDTTSLVGGTFEGRWMRGSRMGGTEGETRERTSEGLKYVG